jgi:hypothetical protein
MATIGDVAARGGDLPDRHFFPQQRKWGVGTGSILEVGEDQRSRRAQEAPTRLRKLPLPPGLGRKLSVFLWAPSPQAGEAHGCALSTHPLVGVPMEQAQIATVPRGPILRGVGQPPVEARGVRPVGRAQGPPPAPLLLWGRSSRSLS